MKGFFLPRFSLVLFFFFFGYFQCSNYRCGKVGANFISIRAKIAFLNLNYINHYNHCKSQQPQQQQHINIQNPRIQGRCSQEILGLFRRLPKIGRLSIKTKTRRMTTAITTAIEIDDIPSLTPKQSSLLSPFRCKINSINEYDLVEYEVLVLEGNFISKNRKKKQSESLNPSNEIIEYRLEEQEQIEEKETSFQNYSIQGNDLLNHYYGIGVCLCMNELQQNSVEKAMQSDTFNKKQEPEEKCRKNQQQGQDIEELLSKTGRLSLLQIHPLSRRHYNVEDVTNEVEKIDFYWTSKLMFGNCEDEQMIISEENEKDIELFYDEKQMPFNVHVSNWNSDLLEDVNTASSTTSGTTRNIREAHKKIPERIFYGRDLKETTVVRFLRKLNEEDVYIQQRCIENRLLNPHGEEAEDVFIIPLNVISKVALPITSRFVQL